MRVGSPCSPSRARAKLEECGDDDALGLTEVVEAYAESDALNAPEASKPSAIFTLGLDRSNLWALLADAVRSVGDPNGIDPCDGGGLVNHQFFDGNGVPSGGDSYSYIYTACADAPGGILQDGSLSLALSAYAGVPGGSWNLAGTMTFFVTLTTPTGLKTLSGTMVLSASMDIAGLLVLDLTVTAFDKQGPVHRLSVLSGHIVYTLDTNLGAYTLMSDGMVDSTRLGGVFTWATGPTGLTGQRGQFPSQGTLVVHGVSLSTVRVRAIDRFTAQVDIDADGDAVFETSAVRLWINLVH